MKRMTGGATLACLMMVWPEGNAAQTAAISESANYTVLQPPAGSPPTGGTRSGEGGTVVAETSTGETIAGFPAGESAGGVRLVPNFTGQLYDPHALEVTAAPPTVGEGGTRQMTARLEMDDDSILPVSANTVAWSETSTALEEISTDGLVSAAHVYQDTPALVHGTWRAIPDPDGFELMVTNTGVDDFGDYAGDGLDDDWQVGYFGLPPNPDAAPAVDADSDGQDNRFEFLSGFSPVDPAARLVLSVVAVDPAAGTADLQLNRMIPGRTYTLLSTPDLITPWQPVGILEPVDLPQDNIIVQDPAAAQPRSFYIISISKP